MNHNLTGTCLSFSFDKCVSHGIISSNTFGEVDGDAVFYNKLRSTNLYVGLKSTDIEVEIYDPDVTRALVIASGPGTILKIE